MPESQPYSKRHVRPAGRGISADIELAGEKKGASGGDGFSLYHLFRLNCEAGFAELKINQ
ncbi:hypothetical protein [Alloyangia pacifica]|uniref:hypothetical protein n=1 Tax=Alloyangia pacifica TaxID=311180 RepID=UPI001CD36997|nr:hypothetical protein [Alloyangia pacifica]MCA0997090.1 hypothetical protein [Alloyangia pacifica]